MIQESGKYLYIPYQRSGGLDSQTIDLIGCIQVALAMKRILVIVESSLNPGNRLDKNVLNIKTSIDWDNYFDLPKTKIFKTEPGGKIEQLPDTLQYIYERDFDFSSYSKNQVRYIDVSQVYDKENDEYPVICLLNEMTEKPPEFPKHLKGVINFPVPFLIILQPSKLVNDLTETVLNYLGTTLESMKTLSKILYDIPSIRYTDAEFYNKDLNCYACIHVRCGWDVDHVEMLLPNFASLRKVIEKVIKSVYARNHKNLPFYIMSSIGQKLGLDFLKSKYDVYRYTDFKVLRERFCSDSEIDYALLYAVEKNIMRHATVKVFPIERNFFIFEHPWLQTRIMLKVQRF